MKLNLGCGRTLKKGYVNVDIVKEKGVDIVHNLNKFPYPFEDNSVDEIFAQDILEHVEDAKGFIEECWRICKPNASIYVRTVHWSGSVAWTDITHVRPFGIDSFGYYNPDLDKTKTTTLYGSDVNIPVKLDAKGKFLFNRFYRMLGIEFLFNKFPRLYEHVFCGIFQCGLLEFNIKVIKDSPNINNANLTARDSTLEVEDGNN